MKIMTIQNIINYDFVVQVPKSIDSYVRQDLVESIMSILENYNLEKDIVAQTYSHSDRIEDIGYQLVNRKYDELDAVIQELEEVVNVTLFNHIDKNIVVNGSVNLSNLKSYRKELQEFDEQHQVTYLDFLRAE